MIPEKLVYTPDDYREILFDGNGNSVLIVTDLNLNEQRFLQDITHYPDLINHTVKLLKSSSVEFGNQEDRKTAIKIIEILTKLNKW